MSVRATLAASGRAQVDEDDDEAGVDEDDEAGVEEDDEDGVDPLGLAASLLVDELSLLPAELSDDELEVDAVRDDEPRLSVL